MTDTNHRSDAAPRRTLRILLVGEGNLSFAHALVKRLSASAFFLRWRSGDGDAPDTANTGGGTQCAVLATTFDSRADLTARYPEAVPILAYFSSKSRILVEYAGGVNATDMEDTLSRAGHQQYDPHLLIFNNPHIGFEDLYRQGSLISHFFASAGALPKVFGRGSPFPRQVVVALCDDQPRRWGLLTAAARNGFACVAAVPVIPGDYPEYENKRHQSDATFPYKVMVQYYFAEASEPAVRKLLTDDMPSVIGDWPRSIAGVRGTSSAPDGDGGLRVDTSEWFTATELALARPLTSPLPDSPLASTTTTTTAEEACKPFPASLPARYQELQAACECPGTAADVPLAYSVRGLDVTACLPLIHPCLLLGASEGLFGGGGAHSEKTTSSQVATSAEGREMIDRRYFSPYLSLGVLPQLYRLQAAIERVAEQRGPPTEVRRAQLPPTLDPAVLGRPLTQRESVKAARFLAKAGPSPSRKAGDTMNDVVGAVAKASPSGTENAATYALLRCPYCRNSDVHQRHFYSQSGYDQHILTKHSGVAQLHPNMHARVHKQLAPHEQKTSLEGLFTSGLSIDTPTAVTHDSSFSNDRYCAVCDLLFTTKAAFDEHIASLSPRALHLVCVDCEQRRTFPDERALQQHRLLKHATSCP